MTPAVDSARGAAMLSGAMAKSIYEGSLDVAADDYTHYPPDDDSDDPQPIPGLDDVVTSATELRYELDYPFEKPYAGTIRGEGGITLPQIIDAIRGAYREMYSGSTDEEIPNLVNRRVRGEWGTAFHVIDDLVIEGIELDESSGVLEIQVGS